ENHHPGISPSERKNPKYCVVKPIKTPKNRSEKWQFAERDHRQGRQIEKSRTHFAKILSRKFQVFHEQRVFVWSSQVRSKASISIYDRIVAHGLNENTRTGGAKNSGDFRVTLIQIEMMQNSPTAYQIE